jgi:maleylacetate reductase
MRAFVHDQSAIRVVFAAGALARLEDEIDRLGARRALFIASPRWRPTIEGLSARLKDRFAGHFDRVAAHTPGPLVDEVAALARERSCDLAVALGGGGAVGLAKTTALEVDGVRTVALPTTYSGSEQTSLIGITRDGVKRVVRDPRVLPTTVIYDPALLAALPAAVAGPSGMNALAHCVEALYAREPNPLVELMAEEGARALYRGLPAVTRRAGDIEAAGEALYGAWLAGVVIGMAGVALHHATCHVLGGSFGLGHGEANSVILPQAVAYNRDAAPAAMGRISRALGVRDPAAALYDLAAAMGAPTSLKALAFREADLDRAAALTVEHTKYNPRPLDLPSVRAMLQAAWEGRRP